jgi:hypothetical protein
LTVWLRTTFAVEGAVELAADAARLARLAAVE